LNKAPRSIGEFIDRATPDEIRQLLRFHAHLVEQRRTIEPLPIDAFMFLAGVVGEINRRLCDGKKLLNKKPGRPGAGKAKRAHVWAVFKYSGGIFYRAAKLTGTRCDTVERWITQVEKDPALLYEAKVQLSVMQKTGCTDYEKNPVDTEKPSPLFYLGGLYHREPGSDANQWDRLQELWFHRYKAPLIEEHC
jgi:hypothetical protein